MPMWLADSRIFCAEGPAGLPHSSWHALGELARVDAAQTPAHDADAAARLGMQLLPIFSSIRLLGTANRK